MRAGENLLDDGWAGRSVDLLTELAAAVDLVGRGQAVVEEVLLAPFVVHLPSSEVRAQREVPLVDERQLARAAGVADFVVDPGMDDGLVKRHRPAEPGQGRQSVGR